MAQLSTDTLVYTQIIYKVQDFLVKYSQNKNTSPEDFDKEYKKLLEEIENKIGRPLTDLDLFQKGEIPSSAKFNRFSTSLSKDVNNIMNQFENLVANYVNTFNKISNEIETEKNLLSRVKSKINVLEMYSNSSATNIAYVGDTFNNLDYVDPSKIRKGYLPDVSDGLACLSRKSIKKVPASVKIVNQNYNGQQVKEISYVDISNGIKGNNHLFYRDQSSVPNSARDGSALLSQRDNNRLRSNELALLDESPATYFEYEAINFANVSEYQDYEFQCRVKLNDGKEEYVNWANFDTSNPLKLTIEISVNKKDGDYINYISILPFFGYDQIDVIKNIRVSSIKLYNQKENKVFNLVSEKDNVFIGSDISAPSLSNKDSYFYNKGVFRFSKTKADKVYITFEQSTFNPVTIKHAYWVPYEVGEITKPSPVAWRGQSRFKPLEVTSDNDSYRSEDVSWNKSEIVPSINSMDSVSTSTKEIVNVTLKYWQKKESKFRVIKYTNNTQSYYLQSIRTTIDGVSINVFTPNKERAANYPLNVTYLETDRDSLISFPAINLVVQDTERINDVFDTKKVNLTSVQAASTTATFTTSSPHNLQSTDVVFINASADTELVNKGHYTVSSIVSPTSFEVSLSSPATVALTSLSSSYAIKSDIKLTEQNLIIEEFNKPNDEQKTQNLSLKRMFEELKARRASIGIRDVFVGFESYNAAAEIVSKPFPIFGKLDLLSLQVEDFIPVETDESGQSIGSSSIDYYISVDGGSKWIEVSPIERSFAGKPEVLAFNQNLNNLASVPQIAYYNSPEVPEEIKTVIVKAVIKKDSALSATPIIYSYKLGLKVV